MGAQERHRGPTLLRRQALELGVDQERAALGAGRTDGGVRSVDGRHRPPPAVTGAAGAPAAIASTSATDHSSHTPRSPDSKSN